MPGLLTSLQTNLRQGRRDMRLFELDCDPRLGYWGTVVPRFHGYRVGLPGDKLHKLADVVAHPSLDALYRDLVSHWRAPHEVVLGAKSRRLC